jgi:hypothetical protein
VKHSCVVAPELEIHCKVTRASIRQPVCHNGFVFRICGYEMTRWSFAETGCPPPATGTLEDSFWGVSGGLTSEESEAEPDDSSLVVVTEARDVVPLPSPPPSLLVRLSI